MNFVSMGLADRDHHALLLFLKRFMPSWRYQSATVTVGQALPAADLFLIDLAAMGWPRHSAQAHAHLKQWLGMSAAVLLLPPRDNSWHEALQTDSSVHWLTLAKPYNAEAMREVLTRADAVLASTSSPHRAPKATSTRLAQPMVLSKPTSTGEAPGVSAQQLRARLKDLPDDKHLLLRKMDSFLSIGKPFELLFTVQHGLVVHPVDAWVACNTPMSVVLQVCRSDAMARSVTLREVAPAQLEQRLHQLGMSVRDLDSFLLELVQASLPVSPT